MFQENKRQAAIVLLNAGTTTFDKTLLSTRIGAEENTIITMVETGFSKNAPHASATSTHARTVALLKENMVVTWMSITKFLLEISVSKDIKRPTFSKT